MSKKAWPGCSGVYRPCDTKRISTGPLWACSRNLSNPKWQMPGIKLKSERRSGWGEGGAETLGLERLSAWGWPLSPQSPFCCFFPPKGFSLNAFTCQTVCVELLSVFIILCRNTGINIFMDSFSWFGITVCSASLTWLYFTVMNMGMLVSVMGITKNSLTPTWLYLPSISLWVQHSNLHQRGSSCTSATDWQERNNRESSALYWHRSCGWVRDSHCHTNGEWMLFRDINLLLP